MAGIRTWLEIDVKRALRALGGLDAATDKTGKKFSGLQKLGAGLFAGFSTAAVLRELGKVTDEFIVFERGLIAVGKTTNLAGTELEALGGSIERLSVATDGLGTTTAELFAFAEAAGQLGVQGAADILAYTETLDKLQATTDIVGEEGARNLARLQNITGESADTVATLGSVLVALGNTYAATERQILHHAGEVARATAVYEVSSGKAAALGAVLAQFGVRAELAGSSIGRSIRVIEAGVVAGGTALDRLAALSDVTADEFAGAWKRGPIEALQLFLVGLDDVRKEGGNVAQTLAEFGLKGEEVLKVIPLLAKENIVLADAIALAAKETKNATALTEEARLASESLGAQQERTRRQLDALRREIGESLAPAYRGLLEVMRDVLRVGELISLVDLRDRGILVGPSQDHLDSIQQSADHWRDVAAARETVLLTAEQIDAAFAAELAALEDLSPVLVEYVRTQADVEREIEAVSRALEGQEDKLRSLRKAYREDLDGIRQDLEDFIRQRGLIEDAPLPGLPSATTTASAIAELGDSVVLEALDDEMERAAESFRKHMGDSIVTVGEFLEQNWQGVLANVIGSIADAALHGGDIGAAIQGSFSQLGGALGGIIAPGPLGTLGGQIVGDLVGGLIGGMFDHTDRAKGTLRQAGADVAAELFQDEGGLGGAILDLSEGLNNALTSLETALRGAIEIGGGGLGVILDDEGIFTAFANNLTGKFDNFNDTLDFLIVQAIKSAGPAGGGSISGAAPEVLQALQNFAGETAAQLNEDMALALRMQAGRLGTEHTAISTAMQTVTRDILDSVAKGISLEGGIARFADIRDDIMGVVLSQEEIFERRKAAFNLELDLAEIDLLARLEALNVEGQIVQQRANLTRAALEADAAYVQGLGGVVTMTANAARQMEIIRNALAQIADLRITATDIPSFGGGGGGGGDGGVAQRRAQRASLQERIDRLREERLGLDEASRAAAQLARDIAAVQEEARGTGFRNLAELIAEMEAAAARAEAARREGIISPFDEAARGGGLAQQLEDIRQRAVDAVAALGMVNELNGELNRIRAGEAAMIRELGDAALGSLGSQILASRDQAQALGETIRFLTENMTLLGVSAADLDIALAEISSGAFLGAGGFLAQALGDEEQLLEFRRLEFVVQLETHRARIAALEAEGLLSEAHAETLADLFAQVDENVGEILAGFEEQAEEVARAVTSIPTGIIDEVQAFYDALRSRQIGSAQSPIAAIGMEFDLLMEQAERFKWRFREIGVDFRDVAAMIDEMRSAELAKAWQPFLDIVNQVSGGTAGPFSLAPGGTQLAQIQAGIRAAVSGGDPGEAARLAQQGLGIAGGMSSFRLRDFRSFLSGFGGLDTTAAGSEFAPLVDATRAMHLVTEANRAAQTNALTGKMADQTSELRRVRKSLERMEEVDRPAA